MNDRQPIRISAGLLRWIFAGMFVVGLLVTLVALILNPLNKLDLASYIALGVAALSVVGFIIVDPASLRNALMGRSGQYGVVTALMSIFFVAFIIMAFVVLKSADITPLDLTEGREYSLSQETLDILAELDAPVHAIVFTPEGSGASETADLWLSQYERESDDKFTYEFVDPEANPAMALEYDISQSFTVVFTQADRTASTTALTERELTSALTRVRIGEERIVYAITGHGERSFTSVSGPDLADIAQQMSLVNFSVETLNLLEAGSVPADADLVLIAGPTSQFITSEIEAIKAYVDNGGALMVLSDPGTGSGILGNGVMGIDISADSESIATAGADGTVRIWDAASSEQTAILSGHLSDVVDVAFSPDGRRIVTAGKDNTVLVWNIASGEILAQLEGATEALWRVAYSPDGQWIASVGENQTLNVWNADSFAPADGFPKVVPNPLMALSFSPDGSAVAAAGGSSTGTASPVYVWETASGNLLFEEQVHTDITFSIAFSADGSTLYTSALDGTEGMLNLTTGQSSATARYPETSITALAAGAGDALVYGLSDGTVHLQADPEADADDDLIFSGHTDILWDVDIAPDGSFVASASRDGSARIWRVDDPSNGIALSGHSAADPLLAYLEEDWQLIVHDDIVVDLLTASEFGELSPVVYTYSDASPITTPLIEAQRRTFFVQARSLAIAPDDGATMSPVTHTPLLFTSTYNNEMSSWGETTNPFTSGIYPAFEQGDYPGPAALGISAENTLSGARIVVFGDTDFITNDYLTYTTYGNAELFLSAASWLTEGEDAVTLPSPNFDQRIMERPFTPAGMILVVISLSCFLPLAILAVGAMIWITRRRKR